jgi:hypothetical protein
MKNAIPVESATHSPGATESWKQNAIDNAVQKQSLQDAILKAGRGYVRSFLMADEISAFDAAMATADMRYGSIPATTPADAWTDLLGYVLQDDLHNRLTPRVIDIAYTAFTLALERNKDDGGPTDWFNDTRPTILKLIEKLRKDLAESRASSSQGVALSDELRAEANNLLDYWSGQAPIVATKAGARTVDFLRSLLSRASSSRAEVEIPEGWKLVPVKPTIAMCIRGADGADNAINGHAAAQVYAFMLAAAEAPNEGER